MDWTLADIRTRIRRLTGKLSTYQLTDAELDKYINNFYRNSLPVKLRSPHFDGWWEYTTVAGTDEVSLADTYLSIGAPFTIEGIEYALSQNPTIFYGAWPESETYDQDEPYDALLFNRTVILRPPPDDAYDVKAKAIVKPTALVSPSDAPLDSSWGLLIAHGTAIDIKLDDGDMQAAAELSGAFQALLEDAILPVLMQFNESRSVPGF